METRKELKRRISELEKELKLEKHHNRRSALVDKAGLPPCESLACCDCRYAVYSYEPFSYSSYLLGCGKNRSCPMYEKTDMNAFPVMEIEESGAIPATNRIIIPTVSLSSVED